jgi:hypothetical protein
LRRASVFVLVGLVLGCGSSAVVVPPDLRPQAKSQVNLIAEKWKGTEEFTTEESDPWGRPIFTKITKTDNYYNLCVRSAGPDGLLFTDDDIYTGREQKHTPLGRTAGGFVGEVWNGVKNPPPVSPTKP